ncbi:hypothetical protein RB195_026562 [Necator americanus]|uniref:Uncharacterized protein n=1 Tax=Necator americanus TaxID=51031 RepID=A0ABR1EXH6_NECAM
MMLEKGPSFESDSHFTASEMLHYVNKLVEIEHQILHQKSKEVRVTYKHTTHTAFGDTEDLNISVDVNTVSACFRVANSRMKGQGRDKPKTCLKLNGSSVNPSFYRRSRCGSGINDGGFVEARTRCAVDYVEHVTSAIV